MAQIGLYYQTLLETKVSLLPEQIKGNMEEYMLSNLRGKIEGKNIDSGTVLKINSIIDYGYGKIEAVNFMATVVYHVKFDCLICSPAKDLEIICVIHNIVKGYLFGINGPVVIGIQFNNIDTDKFKLGGDNTIILKEDGRTVKNGDHVKVSIISIKNHVGEHQIMTIAKLLDIATPDEIQHFKEEQQMAFKGSTGSEAEFI